ncbi:hypothetical protein LR48_Vigan04g112400 [Vigna angularis]|uniref:Aminotransferase-like plant mobile domain-containing protein n=1 Tax=Phaseolus angularis TaxID=3914 RepID=A0A0L9UDY5_PHAAN|nr:hypothetical protein LR48_Vigan04g112400 [Vigna angularis]
MVQRHLPKRVLRQFGFQQPIPRPPNSVLEVDIETIDDIWRHFEPHVITHVRLASSPYDCIEGYVQWFRQVSHPYMIPGVDLDRPSLVPRLRRHIPDDVSVRRTSPSQSVVLDNFRRVVTLLHAMISCRDVSEGTVGYDRANEALQLVRASVEEQERSSRGGRHVRGKRS